MADDKQIPAKPRLKRGETPSSPEFKKRMREWQRARALAEATDAQKAQTAREAEERAERDVLAEVDKGIKEADAETGKTAPKKPEPKAAEETDTTKRRKSLDEKIEANEG